MVYMYVSESLVFQRGSSLRRSRSSRARPVYLAKSSGADINHLRKLSRSLEVERQHGGRGPVPVEPLAAASRQGLEKHARRHIGCSAWLRVCCMSARVELARPPLLLPRRAPTPRASSPVHASLRWLLFGRRPRRAAASRRRGASRAPLRDCGGAQPLAVARGRRPPICSRRRARTRRRTATVS